jgi:hypothetical protein
MPSTDTAIETTYATIGLETIPGACRFRTSTPTAPITRLTNSVVIVATISVSASSFPRRKVRFGRP